MKVWALSLTMMVGLATAGCSMSGSGGFAPIASTPVATAPVVTAPPPPVYGAFLDGPVGSKLDPADRDKALAAEQDALASGQRKTWKGGHGVYGYVEPAATTAPAPAAEGAPAAEAAGPTCRAFTSTIYVGGRPQVGHGSGCQTPDGSYRIAG
jgi:surface antigen